MKYQIEKDATGLSIQASVPPEQQKALLDEFAKCAAGTCSCPSPQYDKLQAIAVASTAVGVSVRLNAKTGETIDQQDIERCLDHTAKAIV
jgi:hypothetical protein